MHTFFVNHEDDCIVKNLLLNDSESEHDDQIALYYKLFMEMKQILLLIIGQLIMQ